MDGGMGVPASRLRQCRHGDSRRGDAHEMTTHLFPVMRFIHSLPLLAFILTVPALAADWPQFRGPESTAVAPDGQIPAKPKIDWTIPLPGRGLASPIIVDNKLFLTCASGPKQETLHLFCFDPATGGKIWE